MNDLITFFQSDSFRVLSLVMSLVMLTLTMIISSFRIKVRKKSKNSSEIDISITNKLFQLINSSLPTFTFAASAFLVMNLLTSLPSLNPLIDGITRENIIVSISLLIIVICSLITVYYTPSRMTVIAGVAIGLILAVLALETFLALNQYMNERVHT